jgi:hypothetical protein
MSLINTRLQPFSAKAFRQGRTVELTDRDVVGKWSVFFFYPADFTFVCPTELGDLADKYASSSARWASRSTRSAPTPTSCTRPGTTRATPSRRSSTRCSADPTGLDHPRVRRDTSRRRASRYRGTFVLNPDGVIKVVRESTTTASAATPTSSSARCRRPSSSPATRARCAPPSGRRARDAQARRSTWSARSESSALLSPLEQSRAGGALMLDASSAHPAASRRSPGSSSLVRVRARVTHPRPGRAGAAGRPRGVVAKRVDRGAGHRSDGHARASASRRWPN